MHKITKVMAVINDFEMADAVLTKAVTLAQRESSRLEVMFVHEEKLFALPEYFRFKEIAPELPVDKTKVQKEIAGKLKGLGVKEECPILVFVDDTADHVLVRTENDKDTLIVLSYHEDVVKKVIRKSHLPVLVVKQNNRNDYTKIVIPVNFSTASKAGLELAAALFSGKAIELVHDYRNLYLEGYMDSEGMSIAYLDIDINDQQKETAEKELKSLAEQTGLKSSFIVQESTIENDLVTFIRANGFDLMVLGSQDADSLLLGSVSFDIMEASPIDLMIYVPQ
jgi:nucleotide-binding universal stress UspA family protein